MKKLLAVLSLVWFFAGASASTLSSPERVHMYDVMDRLNNRINAVSDTSAQSVLVENMIENLQAWARDDGRSLDARGQRLIDQISKFMCLKYTDITRNACAQDVMIVDTTYDLHESDAAYNYIGGKRRFIDIQNRIRVDHNSGFLREDATLMKVAQDYADKLCAYDHFSHIGPQGSTTESRVKSGGYNYRYAAENLAEGYANGELALWQLWTSRSHREAMLDDRFEDVGVGYCDKTWVVLYGTPK